MRGRLASLLALGAAVVFSGSLEAAPGASSPGGPGGPGGLEVQAPPRQVEAAPQAAPPTFTEVPPNRMVTSAPFNAGVESDVYCSGWLGDFDERFPGGIFAAEESDSQKEFFEGHVVYIDLGVSQGIAPGQEFWIVRPGRRIERPEDFTKWAGQIYHTPGRLRVICAQENTAIAEITLSCFEVELGDRIYPFEPIPIPLVRSSRPLTFCDPSTAKALGRIVYARDGATPLAETSLVYIDLGEDQGLAPGDFLTVFRLHGHVDKVRTILGEATVLKTRPKTSVAMITWMRDGMEPGDLVEVK